jgi:hypothetical protein
VQPLLAVIHGRIYCRPEKRSNQRGRRGTRRCQEGRGAQVLCSSATPTATSAPSRRARAGEGATARSGHHGPLPRFAGLVPWWSLRSSPCLLLLWHLALVGQWDGWIPATGGCVDRDAQSGVCVCVCVEVWRDGCRWRRRPRR